MCVCACVCVYVLSLNRVVVFFIIVEVVYDVSFWVELSAFFVPNDIVVFVLRVVHLDIPSVNLSNVIDRRWGWNRDNGCGFRAVFLSTIMQSVVVKRIWAHDIIHAPITRVLVLVVRVAADIRKPHRCKVGVHEIVIHDFVCLIVVGNVFEKLVLGCLQNNCTSVGVK